jgi:hypothetical protein
MPPAPIQALAGLDRLLARKKKEEAQGYRVLSGVQKTGIVAPLSLRERLDSGH